MIRKLEESENEAQNLSEKLLEAEGKINESQYLIMEINEEREMLNRTLSSKNNEIAENKREIEQLYQVIKELKEIENQYHKAIVYFNLNIEKYPEFGTEMPRISKQTGPRATQSSRAHS